LLKILKKAPNFCIDILEAIEALSRSRQLLNRFIKISLVDNKKILCFTGGRTFQVGSVSLFYQWSSSKKISKSFLNLENAKSGSVGSVKQAFFFRRLSHFNLLIIRNLYLHFWFDHMKYEKVMLVLYMYKSFQYCEPRHFNF